MELNLISELEMHVLECHDNYEFRVRIAAGQLMGTMCHRQGLPMFAKFLPSVIRGVIENLERAPDAPATETESALRELIVAKVGLLSSCFLFIISGRDQTLVFSFVLLGSFVI